MYTYSAMAQDNLKRTTLKLTPELHKRIRLAAVNNDSTLQDEITACLDKCFPSDRVNEQPPTYKP